LILYGWYKKREILFVYFGDIFENSLVSYVYFGVQKYIVFKIVFENVTSFSIYIDSHTHTHTIIIPKLVIIIHMRSIYFHVK